MTSLKERLKAEIAASGPIGIAHFMATCLFDPQHGYYTTREPFGRGGDFVTAPEVSQMFGELLAAWLYSAWHDRGRPEAAIFAEIGPGNGTLMADMLRSWRAMDRDFLSSGRVVMIETSDRLADKQRRTLEPLGTPIEWHRSLDELPPGPLFIVGNELFDAVPVRQYVKTDSGWRERMVGLDEEGQLAFMAGYGTIEPGLLPQDAAAQPDGAIFEVSPARTAIMQAMAERVRTHGGAGLLIDYGHLEPGFADTLQAVRAHAYADILAEPGKADLTAHVDFAALAAIARQYGLAVEMTTQGGFLLSMGLLERAGALGARLDEAGRERLRDEVERLAGPEKMGTLFKVLAFGPAGLPLLPGEDGSD